MKKKKNVFNVKKIATNVMRMDVMFVLKDFSWMILLKNAKNVKLINVFLAIQKKFVKNALMEIILMKPLKNVSLVKIIV